MSGSSGKNGVGLGRGIFRKVLGADRSTDRAAAEKQSVFDSTNNDDGFRAIPMHNAADPGIMELNKEGFVIYNLPEDNDIFVSRPGDKAFFEEDEPILIKVSTEDFGTSDVDVNKDIKHPEVSEDTVNVGLRPEQFFVHAMPRQVFDDIDFNEVIVKQHNEEEAPLADLGKKEEFVDTGMTNVSKPEDQKAMTCDGAVAEPICMHTINFTDEADIVEEVEESTDSGDFKMDTQGLHIEGAKNINSAEAEDKIEYSTSFSGEIFKDLAVTSEAQERPAMQLSEVPADPVADIAVEIPAVESRSKIVEVYDVKDIVADVLKLTLPELNEDEMIVCDLPADIERNIPEDGLESFDVKFNLRAAKVVPVSSVAMDFGRKKIQTIGSSLNFTF
jgi:hypothetical protein